MRRDGRTNMTRLKVAFRNYANAPKVFRFLSKSSLLILNREDGRCCELGKPEGKRQLGRPRRRWVDNIRMDLQEVGCGHVDRIVLAQYRDGWQKLVNAVMNLRVQ